MCEQADIGSHAHSVLFLFFGGVTYGNLDVQSSMSCFNILCEGYCFSLWILTGTRVPHFWGFATPLCCGHQQFCWCKIPPYTIPCSCRFYGLSHMRVPDQLLDIFLCLLAPPINLARSPFLSLSELSLLDLVWGFTGGNVYHCGPSHTWLWNAFDLVGTGASVFLLFLVLSHGGKLVHPG